MRRLGMRFGTIAIVGRPNVGKTTLLNAALGDDLAVVSPVPQTTRDVLLGVAHRKDAQIAFLDTPGVHRPRSELGRRMNNSAFDAVRAADVVVLMTDIGRPTGPKRPVGARKRAPSIPEEDRRLAETLHERPGKVLAINKVDLVRDKNVLLPLLEAYAALASFDEILPLSLHEAKDVERLLAVVERLLPEGPPGYGDDTLTDRPSSFFVREYVRAQVLELCHSEVPHAAAVSIDRMSETPDRCLIQATVHVEKVGQRKILVGSGGETIRAIGIGARKRIERLLGRKVRLELFVRVTPRWREIPRQLAELGYEQSGTPPTKS